MVQNYTTQPGLHKLPNRRGYRRNNELVNEKDVSLLQYSRTSRDNRRRPSASRCSIQRIDQNEKINEKSLTLAGIFKMKRKDQWKQFFSCRTGRDKGRRAEGSSCSTTAGGSGKPVSPLDYVSLKYVFLASQDALEVMRVTDWTLALTLLMWPWWVMIHKKLSKDESYLAMKVILWWKLSCDES